MDRQEEIERAAGRLFWEHGYHQTSVSDIARAVGLSKPTLYHYIKAKGDLLHTIASHTIRSFNDDLERRLAEGRPVPDTLTAWVRDHVMRITSERDTVAVLLREARDLDGDAKREIQDLSERYVGNVVRLIERGIDSGDFGPVEDVEATALFLLGSLNWMHTWYRPGGRLSAGVLAELMAKTFLRSLGCDA